MNDNLSRIYADRFLATGLEKRRKVWRVLCRSFFDDLMELEGSVLELACGYGEFINNVAAKHKFAIDTNPDASRYLKDDVVFYHSDAQAMTELSDGSIDRVFTSNFLEHLPDKAACNRVFAETYRILRPCGRFIVMGPNIRYAYKEYWDYYDHYLPLSHLSLQEGLIGAGFEIDRVISRFLPYTMKSRLPTSELLIRGYLRIPLLWWLLGKQFLVVGRKGNA